MANLLSSLFLSLLLSSLLSLSSAACTAATFSGGRTFQRCLDLDVLSASLHWTYLPGNASFAFKAKSDGWAAWGLNPTATGMVGTQAFTAYRGGASGISFFTTDLTSKRLKLEEGNISLSYSDYSAEYVKGEIIIYVKVVLPGKGSLFSHSWQVGPLKADGTPGAHPFGGDNDKSYGPLELGTPGTPGSSPAAPGSPGSAPSPGTPKSTPAGGTPSSTPGKSGAAQLGRGAGFFGCFLAVVGMFLW